LALIWARLRKDKATGKEQKIVIQASSGLSEAEIQRMVRDAEAHAAEDARKREEVELRNRADSAHYEAEKILREQGDKLPEPVRVQLAEKSSSVKRALDVNDVNAVRSALEALQRTVMSFGQSVYGTPQAGASETPGTNGHGGSPTPEATVEGEYREV
jgi:molecular chaperone DnaK